MKQKFSRLAGAAFALAITIGLVTQTNLTSKVSQAWERGKREAARCTTNSPAALYSFAQSFK